MTLTKLPDLERLVARISTGNCKLKDFLSTLDSFKNAQNSINNLKNETTQIPALIYEVINAFPNISSLVSYFKKGFDYSMVDQEGFIVPFPGAEEEYDRALEAFNRVKGELSDLLEDQKKLLKYSTI